MIKKIFATIVIVNQFFLQFVTLFEFIARGLQLPYISIFLWGGHFALMWIIRDKNGNILFHPRRASRFGLLSCYSFDILKYLKQA